jgi:hypothetical protein
MTNVTVHHSDGKKFENEYCHQDIVLNAVPIPIITTNPDLTILSINTATTKMLEMPPESILGEKYNLLFQFSDSLNGGCVAIEAMRRSRPMSGQATAYIKGRTILVDYGAIPVSDENGQIKSVVNYLVDRSDRQLFYEEVTSLGDQISAGSLGSRADLTNFSEPYRSALATMNRMLDTLIIPLYGIEAAANQIAGNNTPLLLNSSDNGELGELINTINRMLLSKSADKTPASQLHDEMSHLTIILEMIRLDLLHLGHGLQSGDFGIRIETEDYEGDFRSAVEALNEGLSYSEKALVRISGFLSQIRVQGSIYG